MNVDLTVPNTSAADAGAVFGDDERQGMDFERWQARIVAVAVEVVRPTLGFRFGRDDHRIPVFAHPGKALRVDTLRYLEFVAVAVARPLLDARTLERELKIAGNHVSMNDIGYSFCALGMFSLA
nr:hypothetical protein [Halococcus thailandensis]